MADSGALYNFGKSIHKLGEMLIEDDIDDLGFFEYYGRNSHVYHGIRSPDHPSPFHHWQVGGAFIVLGQLLGVYALAREMQDEEEEPTSAFGIKTMYF